MRGFITLLFLLLTVLPSACISTETAAANAQLELPDTTSSITTGDLRIGPMDVVNVSVFGVPELDADYQVDFSDAIRMPLVGEVPARGLTAFELARKIETLLNETILQDSSVNVVVKESVGKRVTLDGSVVKPGLYPMEGRTTLLQAVATAGGPSDGANPKNVVIFRTIQGERKAAGFNLELIRKGEAEDPEVFGNDIIVVDGSEARQIYGDVLRSIPLLSFLLIF